MRVKERITPDAERAARYAEKYAPFTKLYPALKEIYAHMSV